MLRQMLGLAAVVVTWLSLTTPSHATATLECVGVDAPDVYVRLTLGNVPVLAVVNALVTTPTASYAYFPEGDQKEVVFGQGMATPDGLSVDLVDPQVLDVLVTLRTLQAHRDRHHAHVGVLVVEDRDVHAVVCDS